jgi:hypothetical protein
LPGKTYKATFGNTFRVVLAENEDALAQNGYLGFPVAKKVELPADWEALLAGA